MDYSVNISFFTKNTTMEYAAYAAANAGFTALDYTPPVREDNWQEVLERDLETFRKEGLRVHQTHAPFNRYGSCGDRHAIVLERAYQATKISGAKCMVVHGDEFDFANLEYTPERAEEYNYALFYPYAEKAAADNITLCFENLFREGPDRHPRHCSTVAQLRGLIERFNSENVRCCWDFGHANVAFAEEQAYMIAAMAPYIVCTHIHDNFNGIDMHITPFWGKVDWKKCIGNLKAQPYSGTLNLELNRGNIPEPLVESMMTLDCNTLKYLWKEF